MVTQKMRNIILKAGFILILTYSIVTIYVIGADWFGIQAPSHLVYVIPLGFLGLVFLISGFVIPIRTELSYVDSIIVQDMKEGKMALSSNYWQKNKQQKKPVT